MSESICSINILHVMYWTDADVIMVKRLQCLLKQLTFKKSPFITCYNRSNPIHVYLSLCTTTVVWREEVGSKAENATAASGFTASGLAC